jgi:hypothetical protein
MDVGNVSLPACLLPRFVGSFVGFPGFVVRLVWFCGSGNDKGCAQVLALARVHDVPFLVGGSSGVRSFVETWMRRPQWRSLTLLATMVDNPRRKSTARKLHAHLCPRVSSYERALQ